MDSSGNLYMGVDKSVTFFIRLRRYPPPPPQFLSLKGLGDEGLFGAQWMAKATLLFTSSQTAHDKLFWWRFHSHRALALRFAEFLQLFRHNRVVIRQHCYRKQHCIRRTCFASRKRRYRDTSAQSNTVNHPVQGESGTLAEKRSTGIH